MKPNSSAVTQCLTLILVVFSLPVTGEAAEPTPAELNVLHTQHMEAHFKAREQNDSKAAAQAARQVAEVERLMIRQVERDSPDNKKLLDQLRNRLNGVLDWLVDVDVDAGNFENAITLRKEILQATAVVHGEKDWHTTDARLELEDTQQQATFTAADLKQLATIQQLQGQAQQAFENQEAKKAVSLELQILELRSKVLGPDHPDVASTCNNIGYLFRQTGAMDRAIEHYRRGATIRQKRMGTPHPKTQAIMVSLADSLKKHANVLTVTNMFAPANAALAEAIGLQETRYGADHWKARESRVQARHITRLAALSPKKLASLAKAEKLNQEAVRLFQAKKTKEAVKTIDAALEIRRSLLTAEDPDTLICLLNRAILAGNTGDEATAEKMHRENMEIRLALYGTVHPGSREAVNSLAETLTRIAQRELRAEEFTSAATRWREVVRLRTVLLGKDHWQVRDAAANADNAVELGGLSRQKREQLRAADLLTPKITGLFRKGEFANALPMAVEQLRVRKMHLSPQHPDTAISLNILAEMYKSLGDYDKALPLYQESLEIKKKALGPQHPDTGGSLNNLALLHQSMGDYDKALPLLQESLEIKKKALGRPDADTATGLNNLAALYQSMGDYDKALPLYQKSLEIKKKVLGPQHPSTATSLNNLAALYESMGDYAKALPLYQQNLEFRKKVLGPQHPDTANSLNSSALLYGSLGDYAKALPLLQESLEIRRKVLGRQHPSTAISLNNLAELYGSMGDYAKALPLYQQSLEIQKKVLGPQHPSTATSLNNLASLYRSMGDYAKALPLCQESLEIQKKVLGPQHPSTARSLNNLASLYRSMGDYDKALPLFQQSLEFTRKVLGPQHPNTAISLGNLAELYGSMGDYAKALPLLQQSLEIQEKVLGPQHPSTAYSLNDLARLFKSMGEYDKALPLYQQSLEIARKVLGPQHPDTTTSLNNLAMLYQSMGDYAKAEKLMRRVLRFTRASLETTAFVQSERQQLAMAEGVRYQLDNYLSLAIISKQFREQAYRELFDWKGATLVRQLQMRKVSENTDVAPLFKQLQQTATRLATLSRMTPDPKQHTTWRRQIIDLTAEKERLEAELSAKSGEFRQAKRRVTLEDMLSALPKDAALVDFTVYLKSPQTTDGKKLKSVRSLAAFVVRADQPIKLLDLGPVAPVSEAIDTWRTTFGTSRAGMAAGHRLRKNIWAPVEEHLGEAKLVLVSADGALGRLPLGALPGKKAGSFLLEDYRLAMLPVPQLLPALVTELGRKQLSGGLLLMGDVDYDADPTSKPRTLKRKSEMRSSTSQVRSATTHFGALDATAGEVASIKELFTELFKPEPGQLKTLKQAAATEQQFRETASQFSTLHLATHGFFAQADKKSALTSDATRQEHLQLSSQRERMIRGFNPGLLSGLAFSGANRKPAPDEDDGILTADEIASLSLGEVDLVVLSACETGLGEVAGGEGLLGVQRAFQVAGARSTVASLWEVGDVATRLLMERFYRNYWQKKMNKLDALREAQLYLLKNPEVLHNHPDANRGDRPLRPKNDSDDPQRLSPQFWAAFQLSGDWR